MMRSYLQPSLLVISAILVATSKSASAEVPARPPPPPADELEFKDSLATETDGEAWAEAGYRIGIGYVGGAIFGIGPPPDSQHHGLFIRAGVRFDSDFSLLGTMRYSVDAGPYGGLVFGFTVDPVWHPLPWMDVALLVGMGGMLAPAPGYHDFGTPYTEVPWEANGDITIPASAPVLAECRVFRGFRTGLRVGATVPFSDMSAFAIHVESAIDIGRCTADVSEWRDMVDIIHSVTQRWTLLDVNITAGFTWR